MGRDRVTRVLKPVFNIIKAGSSVNRKTTRNQLTAAAIGAITGSVVVLAKRSIVDIPTTLIAVTTIVLLWKFRKLQEPAVVAGAAVLGLIMYPLVR